jgi:hypothetical protein
MSDPKDLAPSSGALLRRERPELKQAPFELPTRYGRDRARLYLVDPHLVHFAWEVSDATFGRANGRPGELAVRLLRLDAGERTIASEANVQAVMNWYWPAEPLARYRAEVGWRLRDGTFEPWLTSNELEVPRISPVLTDRVRWRVRGERSMREVGRGAYGLDPDEVSERPQGAASLAIERRRGDRAPWQAIGWSRTARPTGPQEKR